MSPPAAIPEAEIWHFLKAVETGDIILKPFIDPQQIYGGLVPYRASNGWELTVFNDSNVWDYIDEIHTPEGRETDYDGLCALSSTLEAYRPAADVSWQRYRIPGYKQFRCLRCGSAAMEHVTREMPVLCRDCLAVRSAQQPAKTDPDAPFPYVVTCDLALEQLTTLHPWLFGQTRAWVAREGLGAAHCVYYHDYARWYTEWCP